jgi:MFS family permease
LIEDILSQTTENSDNFKNDELYPSSAQGWYVVCILTVVNIFSFVDRQVLSLLVEPIKRDLHLSDTQMSYLMGFTFALFYTVFGLPMGKLVDTKSRRGIIAIGFVFWSFMTAGCGLAKNFTQLMLMRIGIGVGEATLGPSAYSLISDYFPPNRLATAVSVFQMGIYLGTGVALVLAATVIKFLSASETWPIPIVGTVFSWQIVFFVIGLPGIFLSFLLFTFAEPKRRGRGKNQISFSETLKYLNRNKVTFLCLSFAFSMVSLIGAAGSAWNPTFLQRIHGWKSAEAGISLGLCVAVFGTIGVVTGGKITDYFVKRGIDEAGFWVGFTAAVLLIPATTAVFLAVNGTIAVGIFAITIFLISSPLGAGPAALQRMLPNEMRGQASAIFLLLVNLIGFGVGPTFVAFFTDYIFRNENAINYSLLCVCLITLPISAMLFWFGRKPYRKTLQALKP